MESIFLIEVTRRLLWHEVAQMYGQKAADGLVDSNGNYTLVLYFQTSKDVVNQLIENSEIKPYIRGMYINSSYRLGRVDKSENYTTLKESDVFQTNILPYQDVVDLLNMKFLNTEINN